MDDNNPNLNDFNINDDFLNLDIEKIKEIIRNAFVASSSSSVSYSANI